MKKIKLTRNRQALVDDEDYKGLLKYKWQCSYFGYAQRSDYPNKLVLMHRQIMKAKEGESIDHINGDKLDNRKSNLRVCEHWQNLSNRGLQTNNTTGAKGVTWYHWRNNWRARIKVKGKTIFLGYYKTFDEAKDAYNEAAIKYQGEFARLNK